MVPAMRIFMLFYAILVLAGESPHPLNLPDCGHAERSWHYLQAQVDLDHFVDGHYGTETAPSRPPVSVGHSPYLANVTRYQMLVPTLRLIFTLRSMTSASQHKGAYYFSSSGLSPPFLA